VNHLPLILGALGPIFALILLGLGLRRSGFPGDGFWPAAERFTYFLLFPALLVHRLALSRLGDYAVGPVAVVIVALLLGMTALVCVLRPWLKVDGPAFTSVYQGVIRFNTYVGLAVVLAVFQADGGTVAALVMAIMIPLINVLCVLVLTVHAGGSATMAGVARGLLTNPLILGCLTGIGLNLSASACRGVRRRCWRFWRGQRCRWDCWRSAPGCGWRDWPGQDCWRRPAR
jgi:malonate transporter